MSSLPQPDSKVPSKFSYISECFLVLYRSCLCAGSVETRNEVEQRRATFVQKSKAGTVMPPPKKVGEVKPKIVMLRVSMHCNGCAREVEKHISKIKGVSAFKVDLESKMAVIIGENIVPVEVLESVSRVKRAEYWG